MPPTLTSSTALAALARAVRRRWVLLVAVMLGARGLMAAWFPLLNEETYYWEWSQFPALGYVDRPPMVAWMIGLFSAPLDGRSALGLRFGALVAGCLSAWLIYLVARELFDDRRVARWSLAVSLGLPIFNAVGFLALPEGPLLLFYLLMLLGVARSLRRGQWTDWALAGAALGLALLSKLDAMLAVPGIGLFLALSPPHRHLLRRPGPYLAAALALAMFSPSVWWDWRHGWQSFSYQWWEKQQGQFFFSLSHLGEVAGEQLFNTGVFLLIPVLGAALVSTASLPERFRTPFLLVKVHTLLVFGFYLLLGTVADTHPHWTLLAYPTAAMCAAALWVGAAGCFPAGRLRLAVGLNATGLLAIGLVAVLGLATLKGLDPGLFGPTWGRKVAKAKQRLFGWREVEARLRSDLAARFPDAQGRLFTHNRELASFVSFHHDGPTVVNLSPLILRGHVMGSAQRQYLHYRRIVGQSGLYFGEDDGITPTTLHSAFDRVQRLDPIEVKRDDKVIKTYQVYHVAGLRANAIGHH